MIVLKSERQPRYLTRGRGTWALGLTLGLLSFIALVRAEPTSPPAQSAPTNDLVRDALSDDPRLYAKVTIVHRAVTLDGILSELTKQTKVKLVAGGSELSHVSVAIAVKDETLRDVLRAMAALDDCQWKRTNEADGQIVLTLMDSSADPRHWDYLRPKTQAEADMNGGLEDFQQQFSRLPSDLQQSLLSAKGQGVPYTALPPEMQQSVQKAFQAQIQMFAARKRRTTLTDDSLNNMGVTLETLPNDGMTQYVLHLHPPENLEGAMMSVCVPDDPLARDQTIQSPNFVPWQGRHQPIIAAWYDASRAKASQDDPRLNQSVSVKTEDTSIGFPLVALAQAAHVNIIAQALRPTHTISLGPIPLKDALDQITAKYHAAWAEAPDGTILVGYHASDNGDSQKTATK